jgi:hypothetical protein
MDSRELDGLEKITVAQLKNASWLMLCGSIPPGVPPDFYARLIETARKKKVRTLLDTDGEALQLGIEAKPTPPVEEERHGAQPRVRRAATAAPFAAREQRHRPLDERHDAQQRADDHQIP